MAQIRIRSASWLLAARILAVGLSLPLNIVLARGLGADGKGLYAMVQVVASLAVVALSFGLPGAVTYMAAKEQVDGSSVARTALATSAVALGIAALFAFVAAGWLSRAVFKADSFAYAALSVVLMVPLLISLFATSYLIGVGRVRESTVVGLLQIGGQFLVLSAMWVLGVLDVASAMLVLLTVHLLVAGGSVVYVSKIGGRSHRQSVREVVKQGYRFGLASWVGGGLQTVALRQDYILLGYFMTPQAVGVYSVATSLAELGWFVPASLYGVLFPKVSAEGAETADVVAKAIRVTFGLTIGICAVVFAASVVLVVPLFGPDFAGALLPLALLLPGIIVSAGAMGASAYTAGIGKPVVGSVSSVINVVVNFAANIVLIPVMGIAGAAVASSVSYTSSALVLLGYFLAKTDVRPRAILFVSVSELREAVRQVRAVVAEKWPRRTGGADGN